eukprot:6850064-Lingulodinium_polyedra.AAC.1
MQKHATKQSHATNAITCGQCNACKQFNYMQMPVMQPNAFAERSQTDAKRVRACVSQQFRNAPA